MKRYLIAVLLMMLALPFSASAQWYLFPGGRNSKDSLAVNTNVDSLVTSVPDSNAVKVFRDSTVSVQSDEVAVSDSLTVFEQPVTVTKVSLILPLKSTSTPNSNFLDFYCGVLLAADELGDESHRIDLNVYDSTVGLPTSLKLYDSELIIGPVSVEDIEQLAPRLHWKYLVSPLDPKAAALTDRYNIIQAPAGWEAQVDDLIRWLAEDRRESDAVVLLQSADEAGGEISRRMAEKLGASEIPYEISSTPSSYEEGVRGSCRFLIASENEEFCTTAIREIALMNLRGGHNVVYSTSKLRGISDLETESLHAAATRITASYYADPGDLEVRTFSERYRKLFKGEPSQWSFQGYDLMKYFGTQAKEKPAFWVEELYETPARGLQTDFNFDASGRNNKAIRRLKYNANNTISIVR